MLFAEKEFSYYWKYFQLPFYVLLAWTILGTVLAFINFATYQSIFTPLIGVIVQVLLFGYAGFILYEDAKKATVGQSAWSGALMGAIIGLVGAVLSIIMMFTLPSMMDTIIAETAAKGVTITASQLDIVKYMSFTGLISGPLVGGLFGAACGMLGGLVAKYFVKKK